MDKFLSFVTIDVWTTLFTWCNLLILFLLMKKLLFKPVMNIIEQRENEIKTMYDEAETAKADAETMRNDYTQKISSAKSEAEEIVKTATKRAQDREEQIVSVAREQASAIVQKAEEQIEAERKQAVNQAKDDISSIAVGIASKIIERNINEQDQKKFIEEFIDEIGDVS